MTQSADEKALRASSSLIIRTTTSDYDGICALIFIYYNYQLIFINILVIFIDNK